MVKESKLSPASSREEENEVDRISKLPDALIHNILSSMDTKFVVQTSVFSKRWINVWKSTPFLNFDMYDYRLLAQVNDLIDRVLVLRNGCDIQWFRLRCKWYSPNLSRWINHVVSHNVQEVTLELYQKYVYDFSYEIPCRLLNCKSLKKFTLMSHSPVKFVLPKSMSLPNLKFMGLGGISVESFTQLFSSCPLLESLRIGNCDFKTAECIMKLLGKVDKVEQLELSPEFFESTSVHDETDWEEAGFVLPGSMPHLKFLRIEEIEGRNAELGILSFLLKSATVLEEVVVFFRFNAVLPERVRQAEQLKFKIKAFPKASSKAKITIF